jgi:hypothetical protein
MAVLTAGTLAGCGGTPEAAPSPSPTIESPTPTPTPDPTRPALADLRLTTEGLGTLKIGGPLPDTDDPATSMVAWDPDVCVNEDVGIGPDDPLAGGFATDPSYLTGSDFDPFFIGFVDGVLIRVDVRSPTIATDGGLRVGDPTSAITAAHPDAVHVLDRGGISQVFQVTGTNGILLIEASVDSGDGYWAAGEADKVITMIVRPAGTEPFGISGSDNVVFGCGYSG